MCRQTSDTSRTLVGNKNVDHLDVVGAMMAHQIGSMNYHPLFRFRSRINGLRCMPLNILMESSNGYIFRVTGPMWRESPAHHWTPPPPPVTRSFDAFFDLRLNKLLNNQSRRWWFETPSPWRCCNGIACRRCSGLLGSSPPQVETFPVAHS